VLNFSVDFVKGECPERQRGRTVNPLAYAFVGSSPTSPTIAGMYVTNSGYPAGGYCRPLRASSTDMTLPSGPRNVIFWGHVVSILLIRSRASGFQSDPGFSS
jgi:hypothetical protein